MGWLIFKLRQASWSWVSHSELEISEQLGKYDKKPTSPCSVRSRVQIIITWMNILVGSGCHETWGPYRHEGKLPKLSLMFRFPNPTKIYCFRFLHLYTSREKSSPCHAGIGTTRTKKKKVIYDNRRWKNLEYHVTLLRKGPSVIIPFSFYTMFVLFYTYIIWIKKMNFSNL
jgi:hypothetical protein